MYTYAVVMNIVPMSGNADWRFVGLTLSYSETEI